MGASSTMVMAAVVRGVVVLALVAAPGEALVLGGATMRRSDDFSIRPATVKDLRPIVTLAHTEFRPRATNPLEALFAEYESFNLLILLYLGFYLRLTYDEGADHRILVAEDASRVIRGVVEISQQPKACLAPPMPMPRWVKDLRNVTRTPYLSNLLVDPAYRGKGLGRDLVRACERVVRDTPWDGRSLALHHDRDDINLGRFYSRLGYANVTTVRELQVDGYTLSYVSKNLRR